MLNLRLFAFIFFTAAVLLPFSGMSTAAVATAGIYSANVKLAENGSPSRVEAFKLALQKVLVKLSGSRAITAEPASKKILADAQRYVQAYHTQKAVEDGSVDEPSGSPAGTTLHVEFDGPALEHALLTAGLPVWAGNRPTTLVWVSVEDNRQRSILSENSDSPLIQALRDAAEERGIPIILPLMDSVDRRQVEYVDIQGGFTNRLEQAAERYDASTMLIGALRSTGNNWQAKWILLHEGERNDWFASDLPLSELMQSGLDGLADWLGSRYAFVASPDGQLSEYILSVDQILTLQHYATVLGLLQKLVFVDSVTPVRVQEARVQYRIRMRGTLQELQRALALSKGLQEKDAVSPSPAVNLNKPATEAAAEQPDHGHVDLYFALIH